MALDITTQDIIIDETTGGRIGPVRSTSRNPIKPVGDPAMLTGLLGVPATFGRARTRTKRHRPDDAARIFAGRVSCDDGRNAGGLGETGCRNRTHYR
jgi:hypothetical protein